MSMADPALGVRDILVAAGIGTFEATSGWRLQLGRFPDEPATVVLINTTGGRSPYPHLLVNFPSVQTLIRGSRDGYQAAQAKARAVVDALLGNAPQTLNGDTWQSITQLGDVSFLGYDENHRPLFSANWQLIILPASGTHRLPVT